MPVGDAQLVAERADGAQLRVCTYVATTDSIGSAIDNGNEARDVFFCSRILSDTQHAAQNKRRQ
jgi:hypothetical protein